MSEEVKDKKEVVEKKEPKEKKEAKAEESKKEAESQKKQVKKVETPETGEKSAETAEAVAPVVKRKKGKKNIPVGLAHVRSTFNNTVITFTDVNGNTVSWASAGGAGFKGSRKSTPFAAQMAAETAASKARDAGMRSVTLLLKGPGAGRESAVRAIQKSGIRITGIRDVTPIPHNGCRPPKRRRV